MENLYHFSLHIPNFAGVARSQFGADGAEMDFWRLVHLLAHLLHVNGLLNLVEMGKHTIYLRRAYLVYAEALRDTSYDQEDNSEIEVQLCL